MFLGFSWLRERLWPKGMANSALPLDRVKQHKPACLPSSWCHSSDDVAMERPRYFNSMRGNSRLKACRQFFSQT
jgi:hypothetical protein